MASARKAIKDIGEHLSKKDWFEVGFRLLGTLGTAAGIIVGVWQFNTKNADEKLMEFERSLYAKKLAAYESVGASVGDLLNIHHEDQVWIDAADTLVFDSCLRSFRTLYWGVLPLVEDSLVETEMIRFKDIARYYRRYENNYEDLARAGMALMNACEHSLAEHWKRVADGDHLAQR